MQSNPFHNPPYRAAVSVAMTVIFCTILSLFFISVTPAAEFGEVSDEEWAQQPPEDFPDANAMILFDIGKYDLIGKGMTIERWKRIKIFDKTGSEKLVEIHIPFSKGDKIKSLEAHTITPDGKKHKVNEFFDKEIEQYHYKVFTFPLIENGSIVEYSYKIKSDNYYVPTWYFQNSIFTATSSFSVRIPNGLVYKMLYTEIPYFTQKAAADNLVEDDEGSTYHLEMENLPPAKDEPLAGAKKEFLSKIKLYTIGIKYGGEVHSLEYSWADIGGIYNYIYEKYFAHDKDKFKKKSNKLCEGIEGELDKARVLYNYVRDSIKTVEDGEGVDDLNDVLKNKKGLAYEKIILFGQLIQAQDIDMKYIWTNSRKDYSRLYSEMKSFEQFGAVLCRIVIDSTIYVLDPSDKYTEFPHLPAKDITDRGLLIDKEYSQLIDLPTNDRNSGVDFATSLHINTSGDAICTTTVYLRGYDKDAWYANADDTLTNEQRVKTLLNEYEGEVSVLLCDLVREDESDRIILSATLDLPGFASVIDGNLFFRPTIWKMKDNPFSSARRVYPVDFKNEFVNRDMAQIYLPENMAVTETPMKLYRSIDGAKYSRKYMVVDNMMSIRSDLTISRPLFVPKEYDDLKMIFDNMSESQLLQITAAPVAETQDSATVGQN